LHLNPPEPVRLKRFAAPRLVLIFGICFAPIKNKQVSLRFRTRQGKMRWPCRIVAALVALRFAPQSVLRGKRSLKKRPLFIVPTLRA
jgi:hypothetical protein